MKKTSAITTATFADLVELIRQTHQELAAQANKAVNVSLTFRNRLIGRHIAQYELGGRDRAQYGERLLTELARELKSVSNCNRRQLYRYLRFYRLYPAIVGTLAGMDNQLFVAKYQLELPKKEEIQRFIDEQLKEVTDGEGA